MSKPLDAVFLVSNALRQEELFPIREVSRLTGVNPVTLRAWERRYGLIQPTRTDSGHRLYSLADIDMLRSILGWMERGVAVSKVGKILAKSRSSNVTATPIHTDVAACEWAEWQAQVLVLFSNRPPATTLARQLSKLALALNCPLALARDAADLAEDSLGG